jgi:hypothetical protein
MAFEDRYICCNECAMNVQSDAEDSEAIDAAALVQASKN